MLRIEDQNASDFPQNPCQSSVELQLPDGFYGACVGTTLRRIHMVDLHILTDKSDEILTFSIPVLVCPEIDFSDPEYTREVDDGFVPGMNIPLVEFSLPKICQPNLTRLNRICIIADRDLA
jgi:hypothetical protein